MNEVVRKFELKKCRDKEKQKVNNFLKLTSIKNNNNDDNNDYNSYYYYRYSVLYLSSSSHRTFSEYSFIIQTKI